MKRTLGLIVLQIALAFFLIVAGILGLIRSNAGELGQAIALLDAVFKSQTITTIIVISLAVAELIAGVFLIVEFFSGEIRLTNIILIIFMILWIINIILIDIIGPINGNIFGSTMSVLNYLSRFSRHLMILGAIIAVKDKSRV